MTVLRALVVASFLGAFLGTASAADAHPVHEVVQNAYLTIAPGVVQVQLDLTAGPKVAGRVLADLDANHDRRITTIEARAYARRVLARSRLILDGRQTALAVTLVDVPPYAALLGAHGTIRITARAARTDRQGAAMLAYRNAYSPSESRCDANVFLRQSAGWRYAVLSQQRGRDGRDLLVRFRAEHVSS